MSCLYKIPLLFQSSSSNQQVLATLPLLPVPQQAPYSMKLSAFASLAFLALAQAAPINKISLLKNVFAIPLTRDPHFKPSARAQIAKMHLRYPGTRILQGTTAKIPVIDVKPDLEYYGSVSVGTPAQVFKLYVCRMASGLFNWEAMKTDMTPTLFFVLAYPTLAHRYAATLIR